MYLCLLEGDVREEWFREVKRELDGRNLKLKKSKKLQKLQNKKTSNPSPEGAMYIRLGCSPRNQRSKIIPSPEGAQYTSLGCRNPRVRP